MKWVLSSRAERNGGPPRRPRGRAAPPQASDSTAAQLASAIRDALASRPGGPRATIDTDDAVALICAATAWPVGHVWTRTATGWRSTGGWHDDADPARGPAYAALREATALTDLGAGRGVVAAVLHLESCRFLPGLQGLGSPLRIERAQAAGLSTVIGVPVHAPGPGRRAVVAVLEFVAATPVEPDGELAQALLDVAARTRRRVVRKTSQRQAEPRYVPALRASDHLAG